MAKRNTILQRIETQTNAMNLDIQTAVQVAFFLSVLGIILGLFLGIRSIREGRKLMYFRKRQDLMAKGWRMIFIAVFLSGLAFFFQPLRGTRHLPGISAFTHGNTDPDDHADPDDHIDSHHHAHAQYHPHTGDFQHTGDSHADLRPIHR